MCKVKSSEYMLSPLLLHRGICVSVRKKYSDTLDIKQNTEKNVSSIHYGENFKRNIQS